MAESKVRSPSKEKALDAKIAEISIRNKALEERQKIVQNEAKGVKPVKINGNNVAKKEDKPENSKAGDNKKPSQNNKASRAWDSGKTPASEWKTNVPEMNEQRKSKPVNSNRRPNQRRPNQTNNSSGFQHDDRYVDKPNKEKTPDENQKPKENQRRSKGNQRIDAIPRRQNQTAKADENGEQKQRRRSRNNKQNEPNVNSKIQQTDKPPQKRRTPMIRINNRPIPDKVQVRQVVRQLIGRVVMQERLGMPKIERESEV